MNAPSLQQLNDLCFYVSGNVIIHPDACIAADVFLQADPGSQLIIGERVVIGPQSILHVSGDRLTIGSDVTIGSQVLIVGSGNIGDGACIGSFSTLMFSINVEQHKVLPPRSLIGDTSRVVHLDDQPREPNQTDQSDSAYSTSVEHSFTTSKSTRSETTQSSETDSANQSIKKTVVYGRASVERMIQVMFPSKHMSVSSDDQTSEGKGP
ncbi:MAG: hypothetical protein VKL39_14535 [Leptolyngbyaceae bacterium]|nr:hypothetical protein [Leptolyngbyaceae bacterium]